MTWGDNPVSLLPSLLSFFAVFSFVFPFLVPLFPRKFFWVLLAHLLYSSAFLFFFFLQEPVYQQGISVVFGGWGKGRGVQILLNELSLDFMIPAVALFAAGLGFSRSLKKDWKFAFLVDLLFTDLLLLFLANDLFNVYVTMELLALLSYLLIASEKKNRQIWASLKYMIIGAVGFNFYLIGVADVYAATGTLNLQLLQAVDPAILEKLVFPFTMIILSFLIKSGVFFFSMWLPSSHSEASGMVSALLSGIIVKGGIFFLFRLWPFFQTPVLQGFLTAVGVASAGFGVFFALLQKDIKLILAFHTMSQVGFILLGGPTDGALYAMSHALFKSLLFLTASRAAVTFQARHLSRISASEKTLSPSVTLPFLIAFLSISGLFFCSGGLYKFNILHHQPTWIFWYLELISVGTVVSIGKIAMVFMKKTRWQKPWFPGWSFGFLTFTLVSHGILLLSTQSPGFAFALSSVEVFFVGLGLWFLVQRFLGSWFPYRLFRIPLVLNGYLVVLSGIVGLFFWRSGL